MPIVLYISKDCEPHCTDAKWVCERAARELGEELIVEDVDNPKFKGKCTTEFKEEEASFLKVIPVVCSAEREGDELLIRGCLSGVPALSELKELMNRGKEKETSL